MKEVDSPINVCLTGAAGQIAYALLPYLLNGSIFGAHPINLRLLDLPETMESLRGVVMELEDCGFAHQNEVLLTDKMSEAFCDCDFALLVGAMPRRQGMERKDLLKANAGIFRSQGEALNRYARPTVKVLVVGNPANTNALIASHHAPSIPKTSFMALTRLDQSRAETMLALHLGRGMGSVRNVIIWGNHSNTQFPDISHIQLDGQTVDGRTLVDPQWYRETFIPSIQGRGAAVIAARKLSSAMSAAKAIADHLHALIHGTAPGRHLSMAVVSKDSAYGIPDGLFYSVPVRCEGNGSWALVEGLETDEFAREMMKRTADELIVERQEAFCPESR